MALFGQKFEARQHFIRPMGFQSLLVVGLSLLSLQGSVSEPRHACFVLLKSAIRSSFHDDLIEADFDVATLQFFSDDLIYRALCDAGISKPGHRLKIITALREYAGSSPPRSVDPLEEAKETRSKFRPSVSLDDNDPAMTKSTGVSTPDIADRTSVTTTELIRVKNRKLDSTATT
eukprot:CAMPEP_0171596620 /NCGR_PEP_ID=MMETSP0990-20121206/2044_1 /TAXON_ID=483369 /ORGANISM="non described non described, Strain CCMP2098" /LENGTH=174 /DNA_ID=CAMNT_0012157837 /DNA_START=121 /DNA_END=645 /DNA_ORIENTATION=+